VECEKKKNSSSASTRLMPLRTASSAIASRWSPCCSKTPRRTRQHKLPGEN
jgi:hypothetical protein